MMKGSQRLDKRICLMAGVCRRWGGCRWMDAGIRCASLLVRQRDVSKALLCLLVLELPLLVLLCSLVCLHGCFLHLFLGLCRYGGSLSFLARKALRGLFPCLGCF